MDESRIVTRVLLVVMAIWAAGFAAVYSYTSDQPERKIPARFKDLLPALSDSTSKKEPAVKEPPRSPVEPEKATPVTSAKQPEVVLNKAVETPFIEEDLVLAESAEKASMTERPPPERPRAVIHETSKSNGTFETAQEITEGIITGKRGSMDDRFDFYRVRAKDKTMVLRLESPIEDRKHPFRVGVYDKRRRRIWKYDGEGEPAMTLPVTPLGTYYIKVDLRRAPIEEPPYRLYLGFT